MSEQVSIWQLATLASLTFAAASFYLNHKPKIIRVLTEKHPFNDVYYFFWGRLPTKEGAYILRKHAERILPIIAAKNDEGWGGITTKEIGDHFCDKTWYVNDCLKFLQYKGLVNFWGFGGDPNMFSSGITDKGRKHLAEIAEHYAAPHND